MGGDAVVVEVRLDVVGQLQGGRVAVAGPGGEGPLRHGAEGLGGGRSQGERVVEAALDHPREHLHRAPAGDRGFAGEDREQRRAQGVDILGGGRGEAGGLLRPHVGGRPADPRVRRPVAGVRHQRLLVVHPEPPGAGDRGGHPPVHHQRFAVPADHHVRRFDVAVHDPPGVGVSDRAADGDELRQQAAVAAVVLDPRDVALPLLPVQVRDLGGHRPALDVPHDVEGRPALRPADPVQRDHAGVLQPGGHLRLQPEPPPDGLVLRQVGVEELDRHRPPGRLVGPGVDGPEAAAPVELQVADRRVGPDPAGRPRGRRRALRVRGPADPVLELAQRPDLPPQFREVFRAVAAQLLRRERPAAVAGRLPAVHQVGDRRPAGRTIPAGPAVPVEPAVPAVVPVDRPVHTVVPVGGEVRGAAEARVGPELRGAPGLRAARFRPGPRFRVGPRRPARGVRRRADRDCGVLGPGGIDLRHEGERSRRGKDWPPDRPSATSRLQRPRRDPRPARPRGPARSARVERTAPVAGRLPPAARRSPAVSPRGRGSVRPSPAASSCRRR